MYAKPCFRPDDDDALGIVDARVFGTVVTADTDGLMASHLPFILTRPQDGSGPVTLVSHLARANPQAEALGRATEALVIFTGPDAYVSSSWYVERDSAPTWDYVAVHLRGRPRLAQDEAETSRAVALLVDRMERGRPGAWHGGELGAGGWKQRMSSIIGFSIPIERIDAKMKLNQDERQPDTAAAARCMASHEDGLMSALLRAANNIA